MISTLTIEFPTAGVLQTLVSLPLIMNFPDTVLGREYLTQSKKNP